MPTLARNRRGSATLPENALARTAIEAVQKIDAEAKQKKMLQFESLQSARAAIQKRLDELTHQMTQIDAAISSIIGYPAPRERRGRQDWDQARERIEQLLAGCKGQKFAAGDLIREFPELEGKVMTVLLKPLIQEGKVKVDASQGIRRPKYFVAEK